MSIAKHAPEKQMKHYFAGAQARVISLNDQNSVTKIPLTLANQSEVGRGVRQYAKQKTTRTLPAWSNFKSQKL